MTRLAAGSVRGVGAIGQDLERERTAYRDTLVAVGPDAPTACGPWTTSDLAVHVARVRSEDRTWFEPAEGVDVEVLGPNDDLCRWLAGRGSLDRLEVDADAGARSAIESLALRI